MPGRTFAPKSFELDHGVRKQVQSHWKPQRQVVAEPFPERLVGCPALVSP